jgi:hypothetical protein
VGWAAHFDFKGGTDMERNGDEQQIDLFQVNSPLSQGIAPPRSSDFDPLLAAEWRSEAIRRAEGEHRRVLDLLRPVLVAIAISRRDGCVTADNAQQWLSKQNQPPLGHAAGALFQRYRVGSSLDID